ncbi:DNA cytosine methyltransferase [Streptomyces europaeiscabiei]|uniref:DNA cytosine methyltransferase n=1 Tax=Streptomyces europaeiscabiei TaxID=146819 RepID=UPI0029A3EF76|nr:DNA cytosine methyltransferase [Streptomyces europaeiscabiei]MDX3587316.1 DNA cytosine methyltransferase [Streptomyces europaeiscabiei]
MTRIGSLCTGYGGLDEAVRQVFGGTVAWHCQYEPPDKDGREDKNQYAAQILAHHWPKIPNHGDLTKVGWDQVEPVDILTAGFPCQDVSLAGLRAGLAEGTRSGLWRHVARAIEELQPRLVVIENVRGLLSAPADGDVEPCTWCVGDAGDEPLLRALGAVLADLARLRFDAEWQVVRASDVGAPHQRERCFLLAWPADAQGSGRQGAWVRGRSAERGAAAADADRVGSERDRAHGGRRHEPAAHDLAAAHADGGRLGRHQELSDRRNALRQRVREDADGRDDTPADTEGDGRDEGRTEPARQQGGSDAPLSGQPDVQWGEYEPAVRRWERVLGRPAPRPTDALGRLSPTFVEWMQGLAAGHVTSVPGIPRGAQLKALGNGVVPQQAAAALRLLADRAARLEVAS